MAQLQHKVPTNIITGFLGVGKTTAILSLLKEKPEHEKWAVLVNEFGEIGIDGALMTDQGAMIKEVPGGCMCCTAGVPMSVGINALLRLQPDRLLIEPTGLGHPKQVVATLTSDQYTNYVDLRATIALVDPRYLSNEKYTSNQNFNDQLDSADVVIGNKVDECTSHDIDVFNDWVTEQSPPKTFNKLTSNGKLPLEILDIERYHTENDQAAQADQHLHVVDEPEFKLPPSETFLRKENKGQGFFSCGWLFGAEHQFDFNGVFTWLSSLKIERAKAVINTTQGCYAFNSANGVISMHEMSLVGFESRLEIISSDSMDWDTLEKALLTLADISH
ncbi:GTP-binding protein [Vibrio sp.]|nr:GTP-binding protein [Vibrio sp.]